MRSFSWIVAGCLVGGLAVGGAAAEPDDRYDIRDLKVGMNIADVPPDEYIDLACKADAKLALEDWSAYARCPADAAGLHEVSFHFDDAKNPLARVNDKFEGTKIGGHPVRLSLLIGEGGLVQGIRIDTDPEARLFLHKKAFLLATQVKERYGEEGWACQSQPPGEGETPVGGIFIKEHCEKTAEHRMLLLDRAVYRKPGQSAKEFVNETRFEIRRMAGAP